MTKKSTPASWKKGQSGNPKGRPAGKGFVQWRRIFLGEMIEVAQPKWKELLEKQLDEALAGNQHAVRLLYENLLPKQTALSNEEEDNLLDNLTEEENLKLYNYISTIMPEDEVQSFVNAAKKVSSYVKEMKLNRTSIA